MNAKRDAANSAAAQPRAHADPHPSVRPALCTAAPSPPKPTDHTLAEELTLRAAAEAGAGDPAAAQATLEAAGEYGPALLMRRRLLMSHPRLRGPGAPSETDLLRRAQSPAHRAAGDAFALHVSRARPTPTALWLGAYWLDLVASDRARAVALYRAASEGGCVYATDCLGWSYFTGSGTPVDYGEAVRLSRAASEAGDSQARNNYAWGYYRGLGVPSDAARAVELFRQSADEGNTLATCNLGYCYEMGTGAPRDEREARRLYARAAERGLPEALFNLALFECKGVASCAPDIRQAASLLRAAADLGYRDAERQLRRLQARQLSV
eukprot:m51a1_g7587 hypothetical protein (324) ;mRNA; f:206768-208223